MSTIFDVLDKAGKINRPKSRNAGRYARGKKAERKYGTRTPTDAQIRAEALRSRNIAIQQRKLGVKPKAKPAGKPVKAKKKPAGKKDKPVKAKPTTAQYLRQQTPTNRRNAQANIEGRTSNAAVGRGDSYGSAARAVGSRKIKSLVCPLIKTELNNAFNNLLDNFQVLYKDYETDKFNEAEGKGKKPKITTDSRRGAHGGDTQATPPAMGTTRSDQQVMQS